MRLEWVLAGDEVTDPRVVLPEPRPPAYEVVITEDAEDEITSSVMGA